MIAEIYEDDVSLINLSYTPNFYSIFEVFLSKIIRTWMMKGELSALDQEEIHKQKLSIFNVHQKIAMRHFLDVGQSNGKLKPFLDEFQYDTTKWSNEKIARIGIISFDDESGKAQFVHETFAEYFAVNYFVSDLKEKRFFGFPLFALFIASSRFSVIRIFFDNTLDDIQLEDDVLKSYGSVFNACIEKNNLFKILHKPLQEGRTSLVNFILTLIQVDKSNFLMKKVLLEKSETSESILMSACRSKNFPLLEKVWFLLYGNLTTKELADLIMTLDDLKVNILYYIMDLDDEDLMKKFIQRLKTVLDSEQLQEMLNQKVFEDKRNALMHAMQIKSVEVLNIFLIFMKELFTGEDLKIILFETDENGSNFLHHVLEINRREHVKVVIRFINNTLNCDDKKDFFSSPNSQLNNIFHCASFNKENEGIFEELLVSVGDVFTKDELKLFLMQKNVQGLDVFALTAARANSQVLKEFIFFIKKAFLIDELKEFFTVKDESSDEYTISWVGGNKNFDCLEVLWVFLKETFSPGELRQILNEGYKNGSTVLHVAAFFNSKSFIDSLCKTIKLELSYDERKMFFQQRDYSAYNCFNYTVHNTEDRIFKILWNHLKKVLSSNELNDLLLQRSNNGRNAMHLILKRYKEEALNDFLAILDEDCSNDNKRQKLLSKENVFKTNTMHFIARNKNNILAAFWKFAETILSSHEQKQLIRESDKNRDNLLMVAVKSSNKSTVKTLCNIIKGVLDVEEQKILLKTCNIFGSNIFHIAAAFSTNNGIITTLWRCAQEILSKDEIVLMFKKKNLNGRNVLQSLVRQNNVGTLKEFVSIMDKTCSIDERKHLLTDKDELHKSNTLQLAVSNYENEGALYFLFEYMKTQLNEDELKQLCFETTKPLLGGNDNSLTRGFNLLMIAVGNSRILKTCFKIIQNILEVDEQRKMFHANNSFGNNCFQCAAYRSGTVAAFKTLWSFYKEIAQTDDAKMMLRNKNQDHLNTFQILAHESSAEALREFIAIFQEVFTLSEQKQFLYDRQKISERNLLSLIAQNTNENVLEILWNYLKSIFDSEELLILVMETDFEGYNALHLTLELNNKESAEFVFDFIISNQTLANQIFLFEQRSVDGTNCLHSAAINKTFDSNLLVLWTFLRKVFTYEKLKDFMLQTFGSEINVLLALMMRGSQKSVTEFLPILKQIFTTNEIKTLLLKSTGENKRNMFSRVASHNENRSVVKILWSFAREILSPEEQKNFLFAVDKYDKNAFEIAILFNKKFVIQEICEIMGTLECVNDQKSLFQRVDSDGNNILHYAMRNLDGTEILRTLWNQLKKILSRKEIESILKQKNIMPAVDIIQLFRSGKVNIFTDHDMQIMNQQSQKLNLNILQELAMRNDSPSQIILDSILKMFKNGERDDLLKVNNEKDKETIFLFAKPALLKAIKFNSVDFIKSFCYALKNLLTSDDLRKLFINFGSRGCSILHFAASIKYDGIFPILWQIVRNMLSVDDAKCLLLTKNSDISNVVHITTFGNNEEALEDLIPILKEVLSHQEIKRLLLDGNIFQKNALMNAASYNSDHNVLKGLWKLAKEVFTCDELAEYLNITCNAQSTVLHHALVKNNASVVKMLCGIIKESLNEEGQKIMFQKLGFNRHNIFHFAYVNKNEGIFKTLLKFLSEILSIKEIKVLMIQKFSLHRNILQVLCTENNEKRLSEFFDGLVEVFPADDQKILLQDIGEAEKKTISALFIDGARDFNRKLVEDSCKIAHSILNTQEQKELVKRCDNTDDNIFKNIRNPDSGI